MRIKLEAAKPYQDSLIWKIQDSYYKHKGKASWQNSEVPFNISCNTRFAWQNAKVIYEAVKNRQGEKIYILELGAGSGIFSLNFIRAFREICAEDKNIFNNLHYMISDYSEQNLLDISENKQLQELQAQGTVDYYILDVLHPGKMKKLNSGKYEFKEKQLTAVISNYLHCNLPVAVLKKENNHFFEEQVEIFIETRKMVKNAANYLKELIADSTETEILNRLKKVISYKKISIDSYIPDYIERKTVSDYLGDADTTFTYPFASFSLLRYLVPLLKQEGIIFISDKSYAEPDKFLRKGTKEVFNSNTLSHPVNLPLLLKYAENLSLSAIRTENSEYSFHSLMIVNSPELPEQIKSSFSELFIRENLNNEIFKDYKMARVFLRGNETGMALEYYLRVLKYLPSESWLLHNIGSCYLAMGEYFEAIKYFDEGNESDSFGFHDFNLLRGVCYLNLQKFDKAIEYLENSIRSFGENTGTYYFLAVAYQFMGDKGQAIRYFSRALALNPGSEEVKKALESLKNSN